jgi:hypothetical protein
VDTVVYEHSADPAGIDPEDLPPEFLRTINDGSLPPGELNIKIGCPLILLRNLSPGRGLCNGTRMVVTRMTERLLEVQLLGGSCDGQLAFIPRIVLEPTETGAFAFKWKWHQFPVKLAFAMTICKAQGQSVKYIGIDLQISVFGHRQLYVALSRVTS